MIRKATISDLDALIQLSALLWPNHSFEDLKQEIEALLSNQNAAFFLDFEQNLAVGFAQCQLRYDYVEGTDTSPVGYLEGVFIIENYRKQGVATRLLKRCEQWVCENGCVEFASDCEISNQDSYAFHLKFGFEEANRIICFKKKLNAMRE